MDLIRIKDDEGVWVYALLMNYKEVHNLAQAVGKIPGSASDEPDYIKNYDDVVWQPMHDELWDKMEEDNWT